jgi:hypothetical protein
MGEDLDGQADGERQPDQTEGEQPGRIEVAYEGGDSQIGGPPASESTGEERPGSDALGGAETGHAEAEETTQLDSVDHDEDNPDESKLWDHDKTETISAAIRTDGVDNDDFKVAIRDRDREKQSSDRRFSENARMGIFQKGAEERRTAEREGIKRKAQDRIDSITAPYEDLYDTNPDAFANMPTKEFIEVAQPLAEAAREVEFYKDGLSDLEFYKDKIGKGLDSRQPVDYGFMRDCVSAATVFLPLPKEQTSERLKDIFEESFDKTPRQTMQAYQDLVNKYLGMLENGKSTAEKLRQEILDSHRPHDDSETPPSSQIDNPMDNPNSLSNSG